MDYCSVRVGLVTSRDEFGTSERPLRNYMIYYLLVNLALLL
jgi:hypothetical protein